GENAGPVGTGATGVTGGVAARGSNAGANSSAGDVCGGADHAVARGGAACAGSAGADHAAESGADAEGTDAALESARRAAIEVGCARKPGVGPVGTAGLAADGVTVLEGLPLPLLFLEARASAFASAFSSARALASALRAARRSAREGLSLPERRERREGCSGAWPTRSANAGRAATGAATAGAAAGTGATGAGAEAACAGAVAESHDGPAGVCAEGMDGDSVGPVGLHTAAAGTECSTAGASWTG